MKMCYKQLAMYSKGKTRAASNIPVKRQNVSKILLEIFQDTHL